MKVSRKGDLLGYFDAFFKGVEDTEHVAEFKTAAKIVFEFGEYVDMLARSSPNRLHHVYEWNLTGHREARLFDVQIIPKGDGCIITYQFLKSNTPNENGVIFEDKAQIMESGKTVSFETDQPVPLDDGESFRVGPFTFIPGGPDVAGSFGETFRTYFMNAQNLIRFNNKEIPIASLTKSDGYRDGRKFYDRVIY
jgi:hypothetical protein